MSENLDVVLSAPPKNKKYDGEWKTPEEGIYECYVADVEPIANKYYKPSEDPESKKIRLQWTFKIRPEALEDGDGFKYSRTIRYYTGSALGWHDKNKLVALLKDIYRGFVFDPEANDGAGEMTSFASINELKEKVIGAPLIILTTNATKMYEDGPKTFVNVKGIMKSKMEPVDMATLLSDSLGASIVSGDDIEF